MLKASAGFTLVELLVTLVVSGLLIAAVNTAVVAQTSTSERARDMVIANAYAEGKFESVRSQGFLALSDGTVSITSDLPSELKAPRSGSIAISTQSISVKRVVLTITYNDRGTARTYQYTTFVGELGVGQN
jgi:prepilin-type N-terminal cleavage/methylation domain-containing protein